MYEGRAFIVEFPGDKRAHLHVILSEPTEKCFAVGVCIVSFGVVQAESLHIGPNQCLTEPSELGFWTNKKSALDPAYARVFTAPEIEHALDRAEDKGTAKKEHLDWMRDRICDHRNMCTILAVIDALNVLCPQWAITAPDRQVH
ncbi:MAG: hypothetical protein IH945_03570 [Armatimonadetes bacterium]|nr:hypothetical protein [Armatimonadota bacterium]